MKSPEIKVMKRRRRLIKAAFFLVTFFLVLAFLFFCRIKKVTVEGAVKSDVTHILSSAEIKTGEHIYSIDKSAIIDSVIGENPFVASVSVRRRLPSEVRIIIEEEIPKFVFTSEDASFILSGKLCVLERCENGQIPFGLAEIRLPETEEIVIGETVKFADEKLSKIYYDAVSAVVSSDFFGGVTLLDISQRFDIRLMYKSKYTVVYGDYADFEKKIELCENTLDYLEESLPGATGTVYVINGLEASFEIAEAS